MGKDRERKDEKGIRKTPTLGPQRPWRFNSQADRLSSFPSSSRSRFSLPEALRGDSRSGGCINGKLAAGELGHGSRVKKDGLGGEGNQGPGEKRGF